MRGYKVRLNLRLSLRSDCNSATQAPLPHYTTGMSDSHQLALAALQQCCQNLHAASIDMTTARHRLTDARNSTRADELAGMVRDALVFCERLAFIVEADLRYQQQRDTDWTTHDAVATAKTDPLTVDRHAPITASSVLFHG
jgi:hypothetical protein